MKISKNIALFFWGTFIFSNCTYIYSQENANQKAFPNELGNDTSSIDFLKNTGNCDMRLSHGALQGTNHADDSTGYLGFGGFYNCPTTYKILFLYKDVPTRLELGYDSLSRIFFNKQVRSLDFEEFKCYAFVLQMRDPEEEVSEFPYDFPVDVKAYKRINKTAWQFKGKIKAKTFEEYAEFQFKIIYGLGPYH